MPSVQATPIRESSFWSGWTSARFAHPHEQRRPFESSGQIPRSQAQWDPRGGSDAEPDCAANNATAIAEVAVKAMTAMRRVRAMCPAPKSRRDPIKVQLRRSG